MSIRECALNTPAFMELKQIYENREEVLGKYRAEGKKVIGQMGCDVPDELIIAAGMLPVRIYADPNKELNETDKYLEYAFDPQVRLQFEKIVDGTYYDLIDALVISNSTDVIIRIHLYLRELHRVEPEKKVPETFFIDWLFTRKEIHRKRNVMTLGIFREQLEGIAGRKITDEEIRAAAKICNEDREALREIKKLRRGSEVRVNGEEALMIIGSAFFMERDKHAALVRQVAAAAKSWPVISGPRVYVTGSNQEDTGLYSMIEESGAVVVGEDHDWGDRFYERNYDMSLPAMEAIVDLYMMRLYSSKKSFVSDRIEVMDAETENANADGVLFYTNIYEEAASWDWPGQKKAWRAKERKHWGWLRCFGP